MQYQLLELLDAYQQCFPTEVKVVNRIRRLVEEHADCFVRTCRPGHITASAWVLSTDRRRVLLVHHRKLDRWLQPGGHADGDWDPVEVALREVREECGLTDLRVLPIQGRVLPLDVDVHWIPDRYDAAGNVVEEGHEHHDVRFLLWAENDEDLQVSEESHELRWCEPDALFQLTQEESVLRMFRKAMAWMN